MVTPDQYEHWKDFALRMARVCFKHRRRPTWRNIVVNVDHFFDCLDSEDLLSIVDWDNCEPYPEESKYYRKTYRCPCWHCTNLKAKGKCPYGSCEGGRIYDYASAQPVCDQVSEMADSWNPYYWHDLAEAEHERRDDQFCGPVRCCIRAGLDLAVSPSMGVIGFTAGDLRRMYTDGVPDWVTGGKKHRWWKGVIPGVGLVPGKTKLNGTFAAMPDNTALWL